MIVCWRTVDIPDEHRGDFLAWIAENRGVREAHGILFEVVLERAVRQNPAKTLQPSDTNEPATTAVVVTAWASHDAFDAWIDTPDRDRLTASAVHHSVRFGPITRYDVAGGYLNVDGLTDIAEHLEEEP